MQDFYKLEFLCDLICTLFWSQMKTIPKLEIKREGGERGMEESRESKTEERKQE